MSKSVKPEHNTPEFEAKFIELYKAGVALDKMGATFLCSEGAMRNKEKYLIACGRLQKRSRSMAIKTTCAQKFSVNPPPKPEIPCYSLIDSVTKEFLLQEHIQKALAEYKLTKANEEKYQESEDEPEVVQPNPVVEPESESESESENEEEDIDYEQAEKDRLSELRREFLLDKFKRDKKILVELAQKNYGLEIRDIKNKNLEKIVKIINDEEIKKDLYEDFNF